MVEPAHPPGRLRPTRARLGDRFDLALLGFAASYLVLRGNQTLDALSIDALVGRVGSLIYLAIFAFIGVVAMSTPSSRVVGWLMLGASAVTLTLACAAIFVRGLDQALLPVVFYVIVGRRLAERAWYLEADSPRKGDA